MLMLFLKSSRGSSCKTKTSRRTCICRILLVLICVVLYFLVGVVDDFYDLLCVYVII